MITLFLISSLEIYVIATLVAAAVIALCVRPSSRGQAREYLLEGILCRPEKDAYELRGDQGVRGQGVAIECLENGDILLTRYGLEGLTEADAVSLAVTVVGFDVTVEERIHRGASGGERVDAALFTLDFLGKERYHFRYNSEPTATAVSFTLSNRPEMRIDRELKLNS